MAEIIELTPANYDEIVSRQGIVVVDAWASWCGPCRMFEPVFRAAAGQRPDHTFAKLDTEAHKEHIKVLGIEHIPTLMVFRDGILLYRRAGSPTADVLADILDQVEVLDMDVVRAELEEEETVGDGEKT